MTNKKRIDFNLKKNTYSFECVNLFYDKIHSYKYEKGLISF